MNQTLSHVYLYVSDFDASFKFYKDLLKYLGYKEYGKYKKLFGYEKDGTQLWFEQTPKKFVKDGYHRKRTGLNHLAFWVESKKDVDKFNKEFLKKHKIKTLYDTPKAFPKYTKEYYAVFFEDPDRIKLEVAYH